MDKPSTLTKIYVNLTETPKRRPILQLNSAARRCGTELQNHRPEVRDIKKEMEGYEMTWKSKIVGITAALAVCAALALSAGLDVWW